MKSVEYLEIPQKQQTLKFAAEFSGVGIHSGKDCRLTIKPAEENRGVIFVRRDLEGKPQIPATAEFSSASARATTLVKDGVSVFTVEHFLAALHALKIDNAIIEMDSSEPPILDGSSLIIAEKILAAGLEPQAANRRIVKINAPFRVFGDGDHEQMAIALPNEGGDLRISFTSINPHPLVGTQFYDFTVAAESFLKEIAPARTIAYEKEVEALQKAGLGLGGSLENTIVYGDAGWLNPLRFKDELVRHKVLDLIGDLRLLGIVSAHVLAVKSNHALNGKLAKEIFQAAF